MTVELEKSFTGGICNQLINVRQIVPHETYLRFIDLAETIRWLNLLTRSHGAARTRISRGGGAPPRGVTGERKEAGDRREEQAALVHHGERLMPIWIPSTFFFDEKLILPSWLVRLSSPFLLHPLPLHSSSSPRTRLSRFRPLLHKVPLHEIYSDKSNFEQNLCSCCSRKSQLTALPTCSVVGHRSVIASRSMAAIVHEAVQLLSPC